MKRTTIMLPEALRRRAATRAKQRGVSLGELIRDSIDAALPGVSYEEDPLFDDAVFDGPASRDLSANHDKRRTPSRLSEPGHSSAPGRSRS